MPLYMDDYSGKKAAVGLVVLRKGSGPVLGDRANSRNQIAQYCNRLGCSGRMKSTKGTQFGGSEKPKPWRPSFRSSSGKEIVGSSSRTSSAESSLRKSVREPLRKLSSQLETDSSVSASPDHEPEVSELNPALGKIESGLHPDQKYTEGCESTSNEVGSSSVTSSTRKHRNLIKKSGSGKQNTLPGLGPSGSSSPKSTSQGVRPGTSASRYGLRNLRCNSISDVIPSGCSSSDLGHDKKKVAVTKRNSDGESSSFFKGKKRIEPSNSSNGISISDSRRARNWSPSSDNGNALHRARNSINSNPRIRPSSQGNGTNCSKNESAIMIRQMAEPEVPSIVNRPSSSHQNSASHSRSLNSYSRPGSSNSGSSHDRFPVSPEVGITRALMHRDNFSRYNMNGIAEVLLALERIEQDEELSYEQLLVLETNLFLNGLSFHDQHRDMRLDIDNMSYEELLALEDKMGTVSTALTEEALEKCLKSSIYKSTPPEARAMSVGEDDNNDDVKCSICQEDYMVGDEVGRLQCEHCYHLTCIHQWLRLKNWCPICKTSAASSPSPS